MIFTILFYTLIGSVFSLIGGFLLLTKGRTLAQKASTYLVSFAVGVLFSVVFFDLLPEAVEAGSDVRQTFLWVFSGLITFFLMERSMIWYHHHHEAHGKKPTVSLLFLSDTVHNFIDGIVIAGTFLVNPSVGLMTTIGVSLHEIPQEIGDFAVFIADGMSRKKTMILNVLSACASLVGAILTFYFSSLFEGLLPFLLSFSAGMFLYIAGSDLLPTLHEPISKKAALIQTGLVLFGVLVTKGVELLVGGHA